MAVIFVDKKNCWKLSAWNLILLSCRWWKTFLSSFLLFFMDFFFWANFIVCLLQFDGLHSNGHIKNAIARNMARCSGLKRIKLDHYDGHCSSQMHIIFCGMPGIMGLFFRCIFRVGKILLEKVALCRLPNLNFPFYYYKKNKKEQKHRWS